MMSFAQSKAAAELEVMIPSAMQALGWTHGPAAMLNALQQANLPVPALRYLSRMLDREADQKERDNV